jgi:predicted alpha/beta superfamily hydrolase
MISPVTLARTEDHVLHSRHAGADFHLWIGHPIPGMFGPSPQKPRVLYVLDGDLYFGAALEMTRLMHQLYGELPPILVVGVAYGADDPRVQSQLRNRDFTPTSTAEYEQMSTRAEPLLPEGQRLGRAASFLAFLRDEARPYVERHFDVSTEHSILFGSSLGGLFALWAFLTAPESFANYIAVSPSIWWDSEVLFSIERRATVADVDAGLFLAVGEMEENPAIPMLARFKMIANVNRMHEALAARRFPSLRLSAETIAGETHTSVVVPALTRGLKKLAPR